MDCKDMEENGTGVRTRSFRDEDYNNRRAFLRSYPLYHVAEGETANEEMVSASNKETEKKPIKRMIISVIQWSEGKVLVLRKFKHKIQKKIIDTPIVKHPAATQGLRRSPISVSPKKAPESQIVVHILNCQRPISIYSQF
ncbi:hypothetical protein OIU84_018749 [Salix udensis]|uniref:Uncharacterized protein n=1 Tax=Salix udensis TaxID=889485 RepID=A0AAD6KYL7_9ROSI|nr:hypothetical protein OIU84_018749 [Salix udensis]